MSTLLWLSVSELRIRATGVSRRHCLWRMVGQSPQTRHDDDGDNWCRLQVYAELTPRPIAAASLGQVYKGKLRSGETVAVKVQRPYVLETVSIDLFVIR